MSVRRELAGPDSEDDTPFRLMVELDDSIRDHEWIVIGQRYDAGSQPYAPCSLCRGCKKELGRANGFKGG